MDALLDVAADAPAGQRGQGLMKGLGEGFGREVGTLRGRGLDLVIVLDATDSMRPFIEQAKRRVRQIHRLLTDLIGEGRVRFGVVAFKDYTDDFGLDAVKVLAEVSALRGPSGTITSL